jgi:hypothetical protein
LADPIAPYDFEQMVKDEPKSSAPWLELIVQGERAFQNYNDRADNVDRLFADMNYLSNITRDRQYNLFWSNIETIKPAIYARPPIPVVTTKFKDRRPIYRTSSEFLERSVTVGFDMTSINDVMLGLRDDLIILSRGCAWVRYETKAESDSETEKVCVEWIHRRDFLHEPSRSWPEVGWVARRAWMTLGEMEKRFPKVKKADLMGADFQVREGQKNRTDQSYNDTTQKAGVWEIWHKGENKVVWISQGVMPILDEDKPHLKLQGFFPAPKPAYSTTERSTLIPVPEVMQYKDQLEEINELTARIHALSYALQVRGFYPAGSGELGDAIESALGQTTNDKVLIGISNWAAFGGGAAKDSIVWLPTDMVATTITQCVELRKEMIQDVYQIIGISDIQRGATEAEETLGAQQLKNQNGSYRIRDKQNELIRIARDLVSISAEIMAEKFSQKTMLEMSQMEMPTDAEIRKQVNDLEKQARDIQANARKAIAQAQSDPQIMQMAQQNPDQAEQTLAKFEEDTKAQIDQLSAKAGEIQETVTIDQVMKFLRDNKIRPFVLDIETNSTIFPDEMQEKAMRNEFMGVFAQSTAALGQLVATAPAAAPLAGAMLKFVLAPYRAGREMDAAVDEFVDAMMAQSKQPQPNPEMVKIEQDGKFREAEIGIKQQELQFKGEELKLKQMEIQQKPQIEGQKEQIKAQTAVQINEAQAQGDIIAEQARLDAKAQETAMAFDAEAALEAQKQAEEAARFAADDRFRYVELETDTNLAYDQLAVQQENARLAAEAKANQTKPNGADR